MGFLKNTASQKWIVFAFNRTDNVPKTGDAANITASIRKDYTSTAATNDTNPTEIASGYYQFDLTQAETNADVLDLIPVSGTTNIQVLGVPGRVFTKPASGVASQASVDAVQVGIDSLAPVSDTAEAFTQTYGTVISGTYSSTLTDDNTRHILAPELTNGLNAEYTITLASTSVPTRATVNGYFNGTAQYADIYAYDYDAAGWVQLSNSTTRMNTRSSDSNYTYVLSRQYADPSTYEVKIRFVSPSTNTAHRLHIDRLLVYSLSEAGYESGPNAETIADAVCDEVLSGHSASGTLGLAMSQIGTAGAGLTDVPWNASWNAEVQSEVDDALTAFSGDTNITLPKALEMLAAFVAGKVSVSSAGGISTYTYKKRDGSTTSFTAACSETNGTRATTGSLS